MKRISRTLALAAVLALGAPIASGAAAATPTATAGSTGTLTGTITALASSELTLQTPGAQVGRIAAMTSEANLLTTRDYPYVWGGGHAVAGVASIGQKGGPGANGKRTGFDCSGSVAAVLEAAGLWPAGAGVPTDAGVIKELLADHEIARGAGSTPEEVTLYDDPGVHIFMNIDGRFFGTSDGAGGGSAKGGPGWLDDGAPDAQSSHFKRYHVLPGVLRDTTAYGHVFGLQISGGSLLAGAETGDQVTAAYSVARSGAMTLTGLTYPGATTITGTVTTIASGTVTITETGGQTVALSTALVPSLLSGVATGDTVTVSYTKDTAGDLVPHTLTVLAPATSSGGASAPAAPTSAGGAGAPAAPTAVASTARASTYSGGSGIGG